MGKFEKGKSGNPAGRPKGSQNTKTKYIRDWIISLVGSHAKEMQASFYELPVRDKFKVVTALLPYVLPKQTEARISGGLDFRNMSDEQLETVVAELRTMVNDNEDESEQVDK